MKLSDLKAAYGVMTAPPRYHVGPPWANYAGLFLGRMGVHALLRQRRRCPAISAEAARWMEVLERDGVAVVPNFLPQATFARLLQAFDRVAAGPTSTTVDDLAGSGVRCTGGHVLGGDDDSRLIQQEVAGHPLIKEVASALMRRPVTRDPPLILQHLHVPPGGADRGDSNTTLHADRFFPTLKAFYLLSEATVESGAYVYCRGSHRITVERLKHEYWKSIEDAKQRKRIGERMWLFFGQDLSYATIKVPPELLAALGTREESICAPPNTLIFTNNQGLHRRGFMQPGATRKQFRLIFHYLEQPSYAPAIQSAARKSKHLLRQLGLLPPGASAS
jgi:hypothetical protein